MNRKSWIIIAALALLAAGRAQADHETDEPVRFDHNSELFPDRQLSLDLFGTYADRDRFGRSVDHGGGGLGLDYFFTKYVGIGADSYIEEWRWPYRVNGSAILRLPMDAGSLGFAPYVIGGGGREFKYTPQYSWHGGGGVQLKFNRTTGIFADARRVFPDKSPDYTLVRAGLSIGF